MMKVFCLLTILTFLFNSCSNEEKGQIKMRYFESSFIDSITNKRETIIFFFVQDKESLFFSNSGEIESENKIFVACLSKLGYHEVKQLKCGNYVKQPYIVRSKVTKVSDDV